MNQEIKDRLEQAAELHLTDRHGHTLDAARKEGFMEGAQTILENPNDWGLKEASQTWFKMVDELTKYREALERIVKITAKNNTRVKAREIAKEALKQQ